MNKHETNFSILGATGVEDKLQEGVEDTISALRLAGIKVRLSNHFLIVSLVFLFDNN